MKISGWIPIVGSYQLIKQFHTADSVYLTFVSMYQGICIGLLLRFMCLII